MIFADDERESNPTSFKFLQMAHEWAQRSKKSGATSSSVVPSLPVILPNADCIALVRWNANQKNTVFLNQSVLLYSSYYSLQISIHRPFLSRRHTPTSFPSLAICTNAARSCLHILDVQYRRALQEGCRQVWSRLASSLPCTELMVL